MPTTTTRFAHYRTWLFDCDGVLLDSNAVKTAAFERIGMDYGPDVAQRLVRHHITHGGVSRFAKIEHLYSDILRRPPHLGEVARALGRFTDEVRDGMATVAVEPDVGELLGRVRARGASAFVVSGSEQDELRAILDARGITQLVDGVFGSPQTKQQIIDDLAAQGHLRAPAVFIGDSEADFVAARHAGADFVFVRQWSEFADWRDRLPLADVTPVHALGDILTAWS